MMRRWNSQKFLVLKDSVMNVFENHRQFIQISATVLSCGAAWWTFTARRRHNRKMEAKIEKLDLHFKDNGEVRTSSEHQSFLPPIKKYLIVAGVAMIYGYVVGLKHGKRSSLRTSGRLSSSSRYNSVRNRKYGTFVSPMTRICWKRNLVLPPVFSSPMFYSDSMRGESFFVDHFKIIKDDL